MKRLEYQEETVERFTSCVELLVAKRDAAERFAELARQNAMEPPNVEWCGQTWEALKAAGALPKAKDAGGALFVPPWLHRVDGIGRPVPNVCLKLPTGAERKPCLRASAKRRRCRGEGARGIEQRRHGRSR